MNNKIIIFFAILSIGSFSPFIYNEAGIVTAVTISMIYLTIIFILVEIINVYKTTRKNYEDQIKILEILEKGKRV